MEAAACNIELNASSDVIEVSYSNIKAVHFIILVKNASLVKMEIPKQR